MAAPKRSKRKKKPTRGAVEQDKARPDATEPEADEDQSSQSATHDADGNDTKPKNYWSALFDAVRDKSGDGKEKREKAALDLIDLFVRSQAEITTKYDVAVIYDSNALVRSDADKIYSAVRKFNKDKPVLIVVDSRGGSVASAYLISKLCREYSSGKMVAVVPRLAKSAATLICCGADEIHMGSLSELGPIDPQVDDLPALGLKSAIEHIVQLAKKYPSASDLLGFYLHKSVNIQQLGYYERVAESAAQYAHRLLSMHSGSLHSNPKEIAEKLVYEYKDHGFVIDKSEAEIIFGGECIKQDTVEYEFGNALYEYLSAIRTVLELGDYAFYINGSLSSSPTIFKAEKK